MTEERKQQIEAADKVLEAGEIYLLNFVAELSLAFNLHYVNSRTTSPQGKATVAARKALILAFADMVDKL